MKLFVVPISLFWWLWNRGRAIFCEGMLFNVFLEETYDSKKRFCNFWKSKPHIFSSAPFPECPTLREAQPNYQWLTVIEWAHLTTQTHALVLLAPKTARNPQKGADPKDFWSSERQHCQWLIGLGGWISPLQRHCNFGERVSDAQERVSNAQFL